MRIHRIAIETKTFDLVVEQSGEFFKCTISETGRGFLFFIILGWSFARWLSAAVLTLGVGRWKEAEMKRYRDKGKFFLAEVGKNFKGEFLTVTKNFQGGRRVSIMIPKGVRRKGGGLLAVHRRSCCLQHMRKQ